MYSASESTATALYIPGTVERDGKLYSISKFPVLFLYATESLLVSYKTCKLSSLSKTNFLIGEFLFNIPNLTGSLGYSLKSLLLRASTVASTSSSTALNIRPFVLTILTWFASASQM